MTPQDLIRTILDAVAEDDLRKAEDAIEKYATDYAMWVHFNWQHLGGKFFLQSQGLELNTFEGIENVAVTRQKMYELFTQQNK